MAETNDGIFCCCFCSVCVRAGIADESLPKIIDRKVFRFVIFFFVFSFSTKLNLKNFAISNSLNSAQQHPAKAAISHSNSQGREKESEN